MVLSYLHLAAMSRIPLFVLFLGWLGRQFNGNRYNDFDIILTCFPSLASANVTVTVLCHAVYAALHAISR